MRYFIHALTVLLLLTLVACQGNGDAQSEDATDSTATATATDTTAPDHPQVQADRYWNDLARYFGGLPPKAGSKLDGIDERPELRNFRALFDKRWAHRNRVLVAKLPAFSQAEMPKAYNSDRTVFYPFAGADIHTAHALYPNAQKYIMFGLEPEGLVPDQEWLNNLNREKLPQDIAGISKSVDDILGLTFFKTRDMDKDMRVSQFTGTTPILLAFLARRGQEVGKVEPVYLTTDAKVIPLPDSMQHTNVYQMKSRDAKVTGMRIYFRADDQSPWQIVEYWNTNVDNQGFQKTPHFKAYLLAQKPCTGYVKSASYLMHYASFDTMREIYFDICEVFLQDDTGTPYQYIPKDKFDIHLYGKYAQPIPLFSRRYQADLKKSYQRDSNRKDIDFGMGYTSRPHNSNLLIARRKAKHSLVE